MLIPEPVALLLRLASIRPPALHLLILGHARAQLDIHAGRCRKPETLGHLDQIQLVHIKNTAQTVAGVRVQIRSVAILGGLVEVVVLADELLELGLDVEDFGGGELELDDGHARCLEVGEEAYFGGLQEHEGATLGVGAAGGSADAVDVVAGVIWGIELHDPVYCGNL